MSESQPEGERPMRCQEAHERLDRFVMGDLGPDLRQALELHLQECPICRGELASFRQILQLLRAAQAPPLPDGFSARLLARARSRVPGDRGSALRRWNFAAAAAVLIMGLSAGWAMSNQVWSGADSGSLASTPTDEGTSLSSSPYSIVEAQETSLAKEYFSLLSGQVSAQASGQGGSGG